MFPRVCGNKTTLWLLVHIAVICLSAAAGAGTWCWNVGAEEVRYYSVGGPIFATTVFAISEGLFISLIQSNERHDTARQQGKSNARRLKYSSNGVNSYDNRLSCLSFR